MMDNTVWLCVECVEFCVECLIFTLSLGTSEWCYHVFVYERPVLFLLAAPPNTCKLWYPNVGCHRKPTHSPDGTCAPLWKHNSRTTPSNARTKLNIPDCGEYFIKPLKFDVHQSIRISPNVNIFIGICICLSKDGQQNVCKVDQLKQCNPDFPFARRITRKSHC